MYPADLKEDELLPVEYIEPQVTASTSDPAGEGLARSQIRYRILEASGDEAFAKAFADAVFSFYREKRQIVFAFDVYLGGGQGAKALEIFELIGDLKSDDRYARFLENIEVMRFDPARGDSGLRSINEKISSGALVFSFTRDTVEIRKSMEVLGDNPNLKLSYINEEQVIGMLSSGKAYYPLFEIVTISLARYIDEMTMEDIEKIGEEIALRARQEGAALVFTILPSIKRFDTNREIIQYYAMKKRLLAAA